MVRIDLLWTLFAGYIIKKWQHEICNATIAISKEKTTINVDSTKNCAMRFLFSVPSTFLMPTSFARFAECAVVRFIKLMQAMSKINKATAEKI